MSTGNAMVVESAVASLLGKGLIYISANSYLFYRSNAFTIVFCSSRFLMGQS